jgi:hypothetical protein
MKKKEPFVMLYILERMSRSWRNVSLPSSELKSKLSKKPAEAATI